ncbi:hypothetical protein FH972_020402 [Carpinus fangiana]|uniref:Phytocyanin domain-containing protein n=1 Tax=Carpinus fangiana TaxID=176857 RepID=A0A5N6RVA0_9ROSI|nr:hypothetical protein FH972_020402 [Carpinus fangiana]
MPICSFPMANTIFSSNHHHQSMKALHVVGLLCLLLLVHKGDATQFTIGGSKGWTLPAPNEVHYNQWAENNRFQIGDSLVFAYQAGQDSVFHVTQDAYNNCNTSDPLEKYSDGHTVVNLDRSGPFYFISGNRDNCLKNEKVVVTVLADRSNSSNTNQTTTASPPPSGSTGTAPSPAPSGEESPPAGTVEINPTPSPVSEPPPPSGASSISFSFIGFLGAITAASSLL